MYFPNGWPKAVRNSLDPNGGHFEGLPSLATNRDKDLLSLTYDDTLLVLNCKPSVVLLQIKIPEDLGGIIGKLLFSFWRGDSAAIVTATSGGYLVFHSVKKEDQTCLEQVDPQSLNLARESAELYPKELLVKYSSNLYSYIQVPGSVLSVTCWRDELFVSNTLGQVLRFRWDGSLNEEFCFDLEEVPFAVDQLTARAFLPSKPTMYVRSLEYSPLVGGYSMVFNTGRCALLTSMSAFYHPKELVCLWAPRDDVTCTSMNHRYRLIAFGTKSSQCFIYTIDDSNGGLQLSHSTILSSRDYPGSPGEVSCIRWSPDGSVIAVAWSKFGLSVWSTFGSLLFSSLAWEAAPDFHQANFNFLVDSMEWAIDGYQLWFTNKRVKEDPDGTISTLGGSLYQMTFVKSPYTYNSCTSVEQTLYLHGDDRIFLSGPDLDRCRKEAQSMSPPPGKPPGASFLDSKLWITIQVPYSYLGSNWPIRYCAVDETNELIAVAGRSGIAYYSCITRRWKLYSNEAQERDFVVTSCPLWHRSEYLLAGCYDLSKDRDEIRVFSRNSPRLDNTYMKCVPFLCQILLTNVYKDRLVVYTVDSRISIFRIHMGSSTTAVLCEEAVLVGVESDSTVFSSECGWPVSLPYCIFERTTQVCLHHIFRQLIRRNLGFHAWEIARGCADLPYFPHSLELLLHEVLEEEATSKDPIPDPLLPSVIEFIQEFPVYLKTISQCARKTEVALWPYLFNAIANPRILFQKCLENRNLNTAASYLIILQNLEPSSVSRHYATQLLDAALENGRWDLAKDLVRFLRAINPNEVEAPKQSTQASFSMAPYGGAYGLNYVAPSPMPNDDDEMVLRGKVHARQRNTTGPTNKQTSPPVIPSSGKLLRREVIRSTSDAKLGMTSESAELQKGNVGRKFSAPVQHSANVDATAVNSAEDVYLDVILQRHARHLLSCGRIYEMALLSAHLDCPLDRWMKREAKRAAVVEDYSKALRRVHTDFQWPYPETLTKSQWNQHHFEKDITDINPVEFDLGYEANPGELEGTSGLRIASGEAKLAPRTLSSLDTGLGGERSIGYGGSEAEALDSNSDILSDSMFSQLSFADEVKVSRSGALPIHDVERQLRYLMDIFTDAECFDWALVLAIALRDVPAVLRVIGQSFRSSASNDVPLRLRNGLFALKLWVDQHCPGYRPVLAAATNHISVCLKSVPSVTDQSVEIELSTPLPLVETPVSTPVTEVVESQLTKSVSELVLTSNDETGGVDIETRSLAEENSSRCSIQ